MNETNEIRVNETHICILKKHGDLIKHHLIELKFEFEDSLIELKRMAENNNRTRYDLEEYINGSPLKCLLGQFNYCEHLSMAWQGLSRYTTISYSDFKQEVTVFTKSILEKNKNGSKLDLEQELADFHKRERLKVYSSVKKRVVPYLLDQLYEKYQKNSDILAFSHRRVGYSYPEFRLGSDFRVIFKTNFGYGSVSFFYTNINYKNIDILPYSDWIRYRYANKSEIIRYTRRHRLENASWIATMDFTSELYNYSVTNPSSFVDTWIMNECNEMVDGLEYLLNKNQKYEVVNSYFFQRISQHLWESS